MPLILTNARLDLSGPEHNEFRLLYVMGDTFCFARFAAASLFAPWPICTRHRRFLKNADVLWSVHAMSRDVALPLPSLPTPVESLLHFCTRIRMTS